MVLNFLVRVSAKSKPITWEQFPCLKRFRLNKVKSTHMFPCTRHIFYRDFSYNNLIVKKKKPVANHVFILILKYL
jgi:hypothetical protein